MNSGEAGDGARAVQVADDRPGGHAMCDSLPMRSLPLIHTEHAKIDTGLLLLPSSAFFLSFRLRSSKTMHILLFIPSGLC
jgi:hypothetical protein